MSQEQIPLLPEAGARPRRARVRRPAQDRPVARVAVLTPLPHLDRLFDYEIPEDLSTVAVPGARVRVRLAGRLVDGYILERISESDRALQPISSVHGPAVLTPEVAELCRRVADRYAGTLADVLRFAVPPRRARAEARSAPVPPGDPGPPVPADPSGWSAYAGGDRLLAQVGGREVVRALWVSAPGERPGQRIAELAQAVTARGRGVLVVAPDARDVERIAAELASVGLNPIHLVAEAGPEVRYRAFLEVLGGSGPVVVGTRAAVFAPVRDLGLIVVWDDGDDSLAEPHAPGWHAREVAALRSAQVGCSLVVGGPSVTLEAARMAGGGWLVPVALARTALREQTPRVQVAADLVDDPARSGSRMPSVALEMLRSAVQSGPALVSVPRAGYLPMLACQSCREPVTCPECGRAMRAEGADRVPSCHTHGSRPDWRCPMCAGTVVRAVVVGVRRTAEEFGRALPGVPVVMASGQEPVSSLPGGAAMVVATPGSEPDPGPEGYSALVLLDTSAALSRPGLRVAEEVLRRWFAAASLVRPGAAGGRVLVVGEPDVREVQALIRWDPLGYAQRELAERLSLHLPPAVRVAQLVGEPQAARELVDEVVEELGPAILRRSGPLPGAEDEVSWLVAASMSDGARLAAALKRAQATRSLRRAPVVAVRLDPVALR